MSKSLLCIIIAVGIFHSFLFQAFGLDFTTNEIKDKFRLILYILVALSIFILFIKSFNLKYNSILKNLILGFGLIFSIIFIAISYLFSGFCVTSYSQPIYTHQFDKKEIRELVFDCGALDSDPLYLLVEFQKFGIFIKYSEIDEKEIDMNQWLKN